MISHCGARPSDAGAADVAAHSSCKCPAEPSDAGAAAAADAICEPRGADLFVAVSKAEGC